MGDEFRAGTSRNIQDPMTEGLDDMSVNSEAEFDNNEDCEEDVEEESVEVEEGEFDNNEDCEEDVEEESVEVEGEQCTNRWEGYEGVAINSKEDIVSLDLRTMGPDELSYCHFASLEVAYMFYNWYGRMNGFSARKGKIVRNNKGEAVKQTFLRGQDIEEAKMEEIIRVTVIQKQKKEIFIADEPPSTHEIGRGAAKMEE